jgi:hypothetical protein
MKKVSSYPENPELVDRGLVVGLPPHFIQHTMVKRFSPGVCVNVLWGGVFGGIVGLWRWGGGQHG